MSFSISEQDAYFHGHHIIRTDAIRAEVETWCKERQMFPSICATPDSAFCHVWWAYADLGRKDWCSHPGWESYLQSMGYLPLPLAAQDMSERVIEDALVARLEAEGKCPRRQVVLTSGVADIVTDEELYEVKAFLTRDSVIRAVGQLLLYSQELPGRIKIIIGRPGDGNGLRRFVSSLNIEMRTWSERL